MEKADEALLPGAYREVGLSLHASPTSLGSLTLLRSVVQVLCFPLAASMSTHHNRAHVVTLGALLWAAATFCVGASTTFVEVIAGTIRFRDRLQLPLAFDPPFCPAFCCRSIVALFSIRIVHFARFAARDSVRSLPVQLFVIRLFFWPIFCLQIVPGFSVFI
jgi:hypothetical protein